MYICILFLSTNYKKNKSNGHFKNYISPFFFQNAFSWKHILNGRLACVEKNCIDLFSVVKRHSDSAKIKQPDYLIKITVCKLKIGIKQNFTFKQINTSA